MVAGERLAAGVTGEVGGEVGVFPLLKTPEGGENTCGSCGATEEEPAPHWSARSCLTVWAGLAPGYSEILTLADPGL